MKYAQDMYMPSLQLTRRLSLWACKHTGDTTRRPASCLLRAKCGSGSVLVRTAKRETPAALSGPVQEPDVGSTLRQQMQPRVHQAHTKLEPGSPPVGLTARRAATDCSYCPPTTTSQPACYLPLVVGTSGAGAVGEVPELAGQIVTPLFFFSPGDPGSRRKFFFFPSHNPLRLSKKTLPSRQGPRRRVKSQNG